MITLIQPKDCLCIYPEAATHCIRTIEIHAFPEANEKKFELQKVFFYDRQAAILKC